MSDIELVMELSSSLFEVSLDFIVESKSSLDDGGNEFLNCSLEL